MPVILSPDFCFSPPTPRLCPPASFYYPNFFFTLAMTTLSLNTVPSPTQGAQSDDRYVPSTNESTSSSGSSDGSSGSHTTTDVPGEGRISGCIDGGSQSLPDELPEPLVAMSPRTAMSALQETDGGRLQPVCAPSPSDASILSEGGSPSKPRPLVRVVSKATGFVRIVAKRSIRRINRKSDAGEGVVELQVVPCSKDVAPTTEVAVESEVVVDPMFDETSEVAVRSEGKDEAQPESPQLVSSPMPQKGEWSGETAVPDIAIVVKDAATDDLLKAPVDMKPCDSVYTIHTPTGVWHVPVDPSRPQVSESTTPEGNFTPPHIDIEEEHAFGILYTLQYGNPSDRDAHAADAQQPPLVRALLFVLFVPWCVAVGGAILLAPASAGALAFRGGFVRGTAPPRGLRRLAYWADNAYEHVFVFLAVVAAALFYADLRRAAWVLAAAIVRVGWVWGGYRPAEDLHRRVGENDQESLWLVARGSGDVDMVIGSGTQCSRSKICED
ncbi:hypothetical protein C8Q78DRAFT_803408 [Trametes maxima]|nr:hypothetical protein C8Q78DRAFT_803408 [Trametes maxima]